jgi:hypothetical protein
MIHARGGNDTSDDFTPLYKQSKSKKATATEDTYLKTIGAAQLSAYEAEPNMVQVASRLGKPLTPALRTKIKHAMAAKVHKMLGLATSEFNTTQYMYHDKQRGTWTIANKDAKSGVWVPCMKVQSNATSPDDINGQWYVAPPHGSKLDPKPLAVEVECSPGTEPVFDNKKELTMYNDLLPPPTRSPTALPTAPVPTASPTTEAPSATPTTEAPTVSPTLPPSLSAVERAAVTRYLDFAMRTNSPTALPTSSPSIVPTPMPSLLPTWRPTSMKPTAQPTATPSTAPSAKPTSKTLLLVGKYLHHFLQARSEPSKFYSVGAKEGLMGGVPAAVGPGKPGKASGHEGDLMPGDAVLSEDGGDVMPGGDGGDDD